MQTINPAAKPAATPASTPAAAAPETQPPAVNAEAAEAQGAYNRAKFLFENQYGPDPDKEIIRLPDGTDEQGRAKFREWDFRAATPGEGAPPETPPAEAAPETKVETAEEKAAREAAEVAAAKEKEEKKKRKQLKPSPQAPPPVTEEVLEEVSTRAAEKAVAGAKPAEPAPTAPTVAMTPSRRHTLEVLSGLEEQEGYKGIKDRTLEFWKKEEAYVEAWQRSHPGEVFDREDHADWYEKNNPEFTHPDFDTDFERVASEQAAQRVYEKKYRQRDEEAKRRETALSTQLRMRDEAMEVMQTSLAGKAQLVQEVLPEMAKTLAKDGKLELTPETVSKLEESADPVEFQVLGEMSDELGLQLVELERLSRYSQAYQPNPQWKVQLQVSGKDFYPHRELLQFAGWLEAAVASDPNNSRGGKKFLTSEQWQERVDEIMKAPGDRKTKRAALTRLESAHYQLGVDDIRNALISEYGSRAKTRIKELNGLVERAAAKKNAAPKTAGAPITPGGAPAAAAPAAAPPAKPAPEPKIKPPASVSASDRTNAQPVRELTDDERLAVMGEIF